MLEYNVDINRIYLLTDRDIQSAFSIVNQWRKALFNSTKPDQTKSIAISSEAYHILKLPNTPIFFFKGMNAALEFIEREFPPSQYYPYIVHCNNYQPLILSLFNLVLGENSEQYYDNQSPHSDAMGEILAREGYVFQSIYQGVFERVYRETDCYFDRILDHEILFINNCYLEYCIEKLDLEHNAEVWNVFKALTKQWLCLVSLSKACIFIEKPIEVHLDNERLPHAHDQPAMIFGDGSKVYYHHGISFSAKYGEVAINDWKPEWILSGETNKDRMILIHAIGYKRFRDEYPKVDFWNEYDDSCYSLSNKFLVDTIISWQLYHYNQLYLKHPQTDDLKINAEDARNIIDSLPFKFPTELWSLYQYYNGGYQLTPGLYFYPVKQAIQALSNLNWIKSDTGYPFPLFKGTRDEIYYVLADDPEPTYSHIYCIFPGEEPIVYAECVTSLIVTIAQCYQEGAYYITIDEETGERSIEQDLDKIEPIFEKFNPDQIDTWRKIWKG
jgi:hypothetical protein